MSDCDELQAQYNRVSAERDLLLSAIRPEEYATIQERMVAISETPDEKTGESA